MMQHQTLQGGPGHLNPTQISNQGRTVFVIEDNEKKEIKFSKKSATGLSIVQIVSGIISFFAQILIIQLVTIEGRYPDYAGGIGEGIYCGTFFILSGCLGLLASRKPSICRISAFMTLSIIASIFSGILIILVTLKLTILTGTPRGFSLYYRGPKIIMLSIMIVCGVAEMIVSIICAAICCGACCCSGNGAIAGRVVYLAQGENGSGDTQMAGGVPVQIAYQLPSAPVNGALGQGLNSLPSYGDVVKRELEETKEKI